MFSSLATFLFGAQATDESTQSNELSNPGNGGSNNNDSGNDQVAGDVIEVTSSTPSVTGNNRGTVRSNNNGKRGGGSAKNRRGKQRQQQHKQPPTITKLLTPSGGISIDEDFDEDEWYIVEKEDEEEDSLPRSDSEEELSVVELQPKAGSASHGLASSAAASARRRQHINSHSLYSGPRPQQQRNYMQRSRVNRPLSISTLSPPRSVPSCAGVSDTDNNVSQSLYVAAAATAPASPCGSEQGGQANGVLMEESCMSVYRSIRPTQEGTESFVNLDLGAAEVSQQQEHESLEDAQAVSEPANIVQEQRSSHNARFDRHAAAQLKQQTLARQSQKSNNKKQHQQLCRSAIKRSNKVRDFQAKANRPRRSDMQHCKLVSGANNNRKCCF
ncbi:uncharacterized protein LOC6638709 isoform X2 [Drosophila willistoni]|uniref:uncharacterized protein LOC6638709 isoform X2 n=1 Tax=Drosophila willistoni TaxID=7260 RepID=UPI001F07FD2E|nr:uncharacterized protein LOC6638709 isoform X2 [Drosophila willistoni]